MHIIQDMHGDIMLERATGSTSERLLVMRRRYQRGQLIREGSNWLGRWREDSVLPSGEVKRVHKKQFLGTLTDFPTKRLAERELERLLAPINRVDYRPTPTHTFAEFAEKWATKIMVQHKPSTQRSERSHLKTTLVPVFGKLRLRDINPEMVQEFVSQSLASPKTIRNIVITMRSVWAKAKDWGYVTHDPFSGLKLPTVVKGKMYNFTVEETLAIIDKAQGRWKVFFRILAETGMRPGELAGLRTSDVVGRTIRISQSVWQQQVQTPKTENAVRTFAISSGLSKAIEGILYSTVPADNLLNTTGVIDGRDNDPLGDSGELHLWVPLGDRLLFTTESGRPKGMIDGRPEGTGGPILGGVPRDALLLFTTESGRPLSMDNFRHRVLNPILDELGIRAKIQALGVRGGNYAFRHMNMTEQSRLGVPLKTIQKRVGHAIGSDVTMTHYIHHVDSDDLAAADALGALLSPRTQKEAIQ